MMPANYESHNEHQDAPRYIALQQYQGEQMKPVENHITASFYYQLLKDINNDGMNHIRRTEGGNCSS